MVARGGFAGSGMGWILLKCPVFRVGALSEREGELATGGAK